MKILVFTEGTVLMHKSAQGLTREERVKQSIDGTASIHDFANYIPTGNAVDKLTNWKQQGVEIYYLSSRRTKHEVEAIRLVLRKYNFPDAENLLFRRVSEDYQDVAERIMPDVLIEDDCESIGGEAEMTYPHIKPELKKDIKSVVVREFAGIDKLSDAVLNF